jgi:SRSO17 transposase
MAEMDLHAAQESEARFEAYAGRLASVTGHKDREEPLRGYSRGLLTACGRKSAEPLAAVTAPAEVAAKHQSLLHFVGQAP